MQEKGKGRKETENVCGSCEEHSRGDLLPSFRGAPNVEAPQSGEVGYSPKASRSELMHPSGRSQAPHPIGLFIRWAIRLASTGVIGNIPIFSRDLKYLKLLFAYLRFEKQGFASNGFIKK